MDVLTAEDPQWIGDYRLLSRLGAGGMGRVYLARSEGGRTVAVKLVKAELAAQGEFRQRFRQEVEAARRIGHAWTAPVLDADTEAGIPWVATGYIPGPSLQQVVGNVADDGHGPLPERSVRTLACGLAQALRDIHGAGLTHRDFKPSNILITIDGPRVIDFGIARALGPHADGGVTYSGVIVGSPAYMAPEQVRGEHITPASDVFSLGSVLAFASTGQAPFGSIGGGMHAVMFRIAEEEPDLSGMEPGPLRELVAECLDKDPTRRPAPDEIAARTRPENTGGATPPWLPAALIAQLGRHAARLLDTDTPPSGAGGRRPPRETAPRERPGDEGAGATAVPAGVPAGTADQDDATFGPEPLGPEMLGPEPLGTGLSRAEGLGSGPPGTFGPPGSFDEPAGPDDPNAPEAFTLRTDRSGRSDQSDRTDRSADAGRPVPGETVPGQPAPGQPDFSDGGPPLRTGRTKRRTMALTAAAVAVAAVAAVIAFPALSSSDDDTGGGGPASDVPESYVGTWTGAVERDGTPTGQYRRFVISRGDVGEVVATSMSISATGQCKSDGILTGTSTGTGTGESGEGLLLDTKVVQSIPEDRCSAIGEHSLTLRSASELVWTAAGRTATLRKVKPGAERIPAEYLGTWEQELADGSGSRRMTVEQAPVGSPVLTLVSDLNGRHCEARAELFSVGETLMVGPSVITEADPPGECEAGEASVLRSENGGDSLHRDFRGDRQKPRLYTRAD